MIRIKSGLLACAVMIGIISMSASPAQGTTLSWLILNASHTVATELKASLSAEKDSEHLTLDWEFAGLHIAITCTNMTLKGVNLEIGAKLTEGGKAVFTGCKVFETAPLTKEYKCTVKSEGAGIGTIEGSEFKGELVLVGSEVQAKLEPKTGSVGNLAIFRFEGSECFLSSFGLFSLHGTLYVKDGGGFSTTHNLKHLIQSGESTALYVAGHSTKQLEVTKALGSAWVSLSGAHIGLEWSGMSDTSFPSLEWSAMDSASTLSWLILNTSHTIATELKAELLTEKDSEHLTLDGEVAGLKIAVTCTATTLKGVNLEIGAKLTEGGKAVFTGCKVYKGTPLTEEYKCTVKTVGKAIGTIESNEFKGELALVESEVLVKIEPKAGPTGSFATLRFEGAECPLTELNQVHGTLYLKDNQGFATTHKLRHLIESAKPTALYVGGHSAKQLEVTKILGGVWITLGAEA